VEPGPDTRDPRTHHNYVKVLHHKLLLIAIVTLLRARLTSLLYHDEVDILLGLTVGLLIALVAVILMRSRLAPSPSLPPNSDLIGATITTEVATAVRGALSEALATLSEQARGDREESIRIAAERMAQAGGEQLSQRAEVIGTTMKNMQDAMSGRFLELDQEIKNLRNVSAYQFGTVEQAVATLSKRTQNLNDVLSSSQARGQWGERLAEDMLRAAGFVEGINYKKQHTIDGGGKPDYLFDLPPDRILFMDVKFPLDKYAEYVGATDEAVRSLAKKSFVRAVKDRIDELAKRDYVEKSSENTLDYVLLFVPNESINGFVHEADPTLIDYALSKKVVLCSPLSLYAFLVVIRQATDSFHTEHTAAHAMQLINQFKRQWDMYVKSLEKVKKNFETMNEELDSLTVGTRFKELNRRTRKIDELRIQREIPELPEGPGDLIDIDDDEMGELD